MANVLNQIKKNLYIAPPTERMLVFHMLCRTCACVQGCNK